MKVKGIVLCGLALALSASLGAKSQAACKIDIDWWQKLCNLPCIQKPIVPEKPELPDEPEVPETPEKPESPNVPETPETPETPVVPETPEVESNASEYEMKVLELVNAERAKYGLAALTWDNKLADVARAHSRDMAERNFFSHNNPDGKTPFDRIKAAGINYSSAGENIAAGQKTPEEVVEAWMNSEGHRANILNASFKKLGVGYVTSNQGYKTYWTQNFIG